MKPPYKGAKEQGKNVQVFVSFRGIQRLNLYKEQPHLRFPASFQDGSLLRIPPAAGSSVCTRKVPPHLFAKVSQKLVFL